MKIYQEQLSALRLKIGVGLFWKGASSRLDPFPDELSERNGTNLLVWVESGVEINAEQRGYFSWSGREPSCRFHGRWMPKVVLESISQGSASEELGPKDKRWHLDLRSLSKRDLT